jgi:hypothetical protein
MELQISLLSPRNHSSLILPSISSVQLIAVAVAHLGEMRNEYRILVGKPERKRPLGRR